MSDRDFEIGGKKFKLLKIDTFKQFHVVRRIAPILAELLPAMKDGPAAKGTDLDKVAAFVSPIMNGLSKLSDADADFVLINLLSAVEVQQSAGNWAKVAQGGMLMIQDFELPVLLQIAGQSFMFNLSGFFGALPHKS